MTNATERDERRLEARHPIRVVATRTGLKPTLLRAWERRYGVVDPARSEGGQRLYADADIERLSLLKRVTDAGRSIGDVASLEDDELRELAAEDEAARLRVRQRSRSLEAAPDEESTVRIREEAMSAVEALDAERVEAVLRRAAANLGGVPFMEEVISPLMWEIGTEWSAGRLSPAHEHMTSAVVRRVLTWLADPTADRSGPTIVVGTLVGELHDLGAQLAATTAALEGWSVTFLGSDLPASDIAATAEAIGADAVGVSVANPPDAERARDELVTLRDRLPPDVDVLVGGGSADAALGEMPVPGVRQVSSLVELRDVLRELAPA